MSYFSTVKLKNILGSIINPATEDTLQKVVMSVDNAISATAFNLNASQYSATTNISNDFIFDSITLNFSTTETKTITITSSDGTILWGGSVDTSADNLGYNTTAQNFNLLFDQAFNGGDNITVTVTQTTGACLMDCVLKTKQGSNTLTGNPSLGTGTSNIGNVNLISAVSTANSSITPLGSGGVFTGSWADCTNIAQITVNVKSDQLGTLTIQRSSNGVTVGKSVNYSLLSTTEGMSISVAARQRYVRIVYTNGSSAQGSFGLSTILSTVPTGFTFQALNQPQTDESMSLNTIANISGKRILDGNHSTVPLMSDNSLLVTSVPYVFAISEGDVPDHTIKHKMGYSPASTASETTLWNPGTQYVFPAGTISVEAVSSSGNDTAAGTGARTVHLGYLDINYTEKTWTFTMNGTTPVAGPTDFFRVNTFHIETAGTGGAAAGVIDLRLVGAPATIYSQMAAGFTRARNSVFTVPAGKVYYVENVHFSAAYKTSGKTVRMTLATSLTPEGIVSTSGTLFWPYFESMLVDGVAYDPSDAPLRFPAMTDIKVSVIGEAGAQCTSRISGWIE